MLLRLFGIRVRIVLALLAATGLGFACAAVFVPTSNLPDTYSSLALAAACAFAAGLLVARSILKPVSELDSFLRSRLEGVQDKSIRLSGHDEISELSRSLNAYLVRVDDGLIEMEKVRNSAEKAKSNVEKAIAGSAADMGKLLEIGELLENDGDFGGAAARVLKVLNEHLDLAWSSVFLIDRESETMHLAASEGIDGELSAVLMLEGSKPVQFKPGEGIAGSVVATGKTLVANEGYRDKRFKLFKRFGEHHKRIENICVVPLQVDGEVVGLIQGVNAPDPPRFTAPKVQLLERVGRLFSRMLSRQHDFEDQFRESLTGLFTFEYWEDRFSVEVGRTARSGNNLGLIQLELEFTGPAAAQHRSRSLASVGDIVRRNLRMSDFAARDGYSFFIALPDTDSLGSMFLAGRIKELVDVSAFQEGDGRSLFATRGGVVSFPDDVGAPDLLRKAVSSALKQSRACGDDRLVCYRKSAAGKEVS